MFDCENLKLGKESKNSSDKELMKDNSFALLKEFEIAPQFEVLKEIKEEIKEESLKRKQSKNTLTLTFDEGDHGKEKSVGSQNCNFSEISEIKENKDVK